MNNIYDLGDGYHLEQVSGEKFAKYFAVYRVWYSNAWFRSSFNQAKDVIVDCDCCYWIKKDNQRVGGVLIEANYMNCLVLEPPYTFYDVVLTKIKKLLLELSDLNKPIVAGAIKPNLVDLYESCGFEEYVSRKCMMRPTEFLPNELNENYSYMSLSEASKDELAVIFKETYDEVTYKHDYTEATIKESLDFYFDKFASDLTLNNASSLVVERKTNKIVGACLVSLWEEWPNIFELLVLPEHQGRGLGRSLLSKAITALEDDYPVVRLFVTSGNHAEKLYNNMGFISGLMTSEMHLVMKEGTK